MKQGNKNINMMRAQNRRPFSDKCQSKDNDSAAHFYGELRNVQENGSAAHFYGELRSVAVSSGKLRNVDGLRCAAFAAS